MFRRLMRWWCDRDLESRVSRLEAKLEFVMSELDNVEALISQVDAETNRIAQKLDELNGKLSTEMSAEDVATVKASLQQSIDRLKAVGADPTNPVPPSPDVPPPAPLTPPAE